MRLEQPPAADAVHPGAAGGHGAGKVAWAARILPWLPPLVGALPVLLVTLGLLGGFGHSLLSPLQRAGGLGDFYDQQGRSMLRGTLAVPCAALEDEAIVVAGECHGYFGITPALLRLPLNGLCPDCFGRWSKVSSLAGVLATYAACLVLAWGLLARRQIAGLRRSAWAGAFAGSACLGSTLVFVAGTPVVFHEAILWGGAFTLWAFWAVMEYRQRGRARFLAVALVALLLALNSRVTIGLGAVIGVGWVLAGMLLPRLRRRTAFGKTGRRAAAGMALAVLAAASPLAVNFLKFGKLSPPLDKHVTYARDPARLAVVRDGLFRAANVPCTVASYLSPGSIQSYPAYPWRLPAYGWNPPEPLPPGLPSSCAGAALENIEPFYALYYGAPALVLLAVFGWLAPGGPAAAGRRAIRGPAVGALAGAAPVFLFATLTYRYEHDLFPFLVLGGAVGLGALAAAPPERRWPAATALGFLTLVGLHLNLAAVFDHFLVQPEAMDALHVLQRVFP
ncbi:MAG TPA: hypothetical protein VJ576_20685 [Rhodocyclaceae bacterium]|nr:hypothetical protein [Rhodocyclaceae bacterium]